MNPTYTSSCRSRSRAAWVPPLAILLAAGTTLCLRVNERPALSAAMHVAQDLDGDGLVDVQEAVLTTSAGMVDTDGDGYSDSEELARHSSPRFASSVPYGARMNLGVTCHGDNGLLHGVMAVYFPDQNVHSLSLHFGVLVGNRMSEISTSYVLENADVQVVPAADDKAMIAIFDVPFPPQVVHSAGAITLFAWAGPVGSGMITAADSIDLISIDGVVLLVMADPTVPPQETATLSAQGQSSTPTGGTIYMPLPLGESENPANWTEGEICSQESSTVGSAGAVLTQEVTSAECKDGWDTACPPTCSSSVGSTYTTIDPGVLIGG